METDGEFEKLRDMKADELTLYAVVAIYPDDFYMLSKEEAESAIDIAEKVKQFVPEKIC
ncbi:MAG: HEPN domain-containing protein [bacterium]